MVASDCLIGEVREYVAVYKNPPYPVFYDVVYHSYALIPMLASELYYQSKFSSTVLTSLITGKATRSATTRPSRSQRRPHRLQAACQHKCLVPSALGVHALQNRT